MKIKSLVVPAKGPAGAADAGVSRCLCHCLCLCLCLCLCGFLVPLRAAGAEGMMPIELGADTGAELPEGVTFAAGVLTISKPGQYLLSGTLEQGMIIADAREEGKIYLYLNGVNVHNEHGPALQVESVSPRLVISLVEGSVNTLSNGEKLSPGADGEPDGVVYSRSDLTIEGGGVLAVTAGDLSGIVSKDDLRVTGGTLRIEAPVHGIKGKDSVEISGGSITVRAGRDGIKSTNKKDRDRGFVEITGGTIDITCGDEPLSCVTTCRITGGDISITMAEWTGPGGD